MDIRITFADENLQLLKAVIALADANSSTLGFLPRQVFAKAASDHQIIVALDSGHQLLGYLLFRIVKSKSRAAITHLCVEQDYRNQGIARKLVETLIAHTSRLLGISLFCRRDHEFNKFWAHMGFEYNDEKEGRGRDRMPLTHYWYDHGHPSLFTLLYEDIVETRAVRSVIDANVFYDLFDDPEHPLLADWLPEDLAICVTPELRNEIHRAEEQQRRLNTLSYADTFPHTSGTETQRRQVFHLLREHLPKTISEQDESDLKQLSHAIVFEADFFVTNDHDLKRRLGEVSQDEFNVPIVNPDDLIIYLDEFLNYEAYQPRRLAGSHIEIKRIQSGESDILASIFHREAGERQKRFRQRLSEYLTSPAECNAWVVSTKVHGPIGLIVVKEVEIDY